jgi:hypothetical protein
MPKYNVTLEETVRFVITVEADSKEVASEIATRMWCQSEDPTRDFDGECQGIQVIMTFKSTI